MSSVFLYFWRPGEAARRIQSHPLLWPAFTLACACGMLALVLRWSELTDAVVRHLPPTVGADGEAEVRSMLARELPFRCALLPFVMGARMIALSSLFLLISRSLPGLQPPRFRSFVILSAHALFLQTTMEILSHLAGWETFGNSAHGIPGVAWLIVLPDDYISASLIRSMNILTLWYVVALAVGLRVLFRGTALRSSLVAIIAWATSILANLWLIRMMHDALRLRV